MKTIGDSIRFARERAEYTRAGLAKRLDISAAYLGHLENDSHVRLSERVVRRLQVVLGLELSTRAVERHNDKSAKWYRDYHSKAARKAKKKAA